MTSIAAVTIESTDVAASEAFLAAAFDLKERVAVRAVDDEAGDAPSSGFRGFTLSLVVGQPSTVDSLVASALDAGAEVLKPVAKSMWGYGGVLRAPDGTIWKIATSAKKDTGPATREIDDVVLLLGVADVAATKRFYAERGLAVGKSFGRMYVEFDVPGSPVKLALYRRKALAKDAGVAPEGTGSHRLVLTGDGAPGQDPDGFVWERA